MDRDRCLDVIAEAVDGHRRELKVISRGLDLCESTVCSDVASVRAWVTSALEEQQKMVLRVMSEMARLGKVIEGSRRACGAEGKVVEEGDEFSGGYGVQETDASVVKENDKGKALGKPASPAEAPSVQAGVCEGSSGSAAGAVGGTPDQPRLSTVPDVHVRGGPWVPPTLAAVSERVEKAAVVKKAVGCASVHTDGASTVSILCCGSLGSMWMIRWGPMAAGRWRLPVGKQLRSGRRPEARAMRDLRRVLGKSSRRGLMAALRPPGRRRPRAMVMCGVRLQSQRQLLLIWQGLQFLQVLRTMLGPRMGQRRLWCGGGAREWADLDQCGRL